MDCKTCNRCGIEKPLDSFRLIKNRRGVPIRGHRCNECVYEKRRQSFLERGHALDVTEKFCRICRTWKSVFDFYQHKNSKDGLSSECRSCTLILRQEHRAKIVAVGLGLEPEPVEVPLGWKQCRGCGEVKPMSGFYRHKQMADGHLHFCRTCKDAYQAGADRLQRKRKKREIAEANPRVCLICERSFPGSTEYFYHSKSNVLDPWCRLCVEALMERTYRRGQPSPDWLFVKVTQVRAKLFVLWHYSGGPPHCACCGEAEILFLAVDHIHGGGGKHRRELRSAASSGGYHFYGWLKREGFPAGYQILCHNCNLSKGYYGVCPHTRQEQTPALVT